MTQRRAVDRPAPRVMPKCGWVAYVKALKDDIRDEEEYIQALQNNFVFFLWELWIDRGLQDSEGKDGKAPLSDVEIDAANYMESGPRRRLCLAFRGVGKTHFICAICLYRYFRDPARQIQIVSKSEREVKKTCKLVRRWISAVWFLRHLEPRPGQADAATYFEVYNPNADSGDGSDGRQPSMWILGVGGQLEGNRAHTFIFDDIETKSNTRTLAARQELAKMTPEFDNIVYPFRSFDQGGPIDPSEIIGVGTPKHEETLYVELEKRGYDVRSYPIAFPSPEIDVINLAPILKIKLESGQARIGDPTCPKRFNREEIRIRQFGGRREFLMEFMLCARIAGADPYPLKLADLIVFPIHRDVGPTRILWGKATNTGSTEIPDIEISSRGLTGDRLVRPIMVDNEHWMPFAGTKAGLDPAGRGTDRTGLAIVSHLAGLFYLKHIAGLPGGADEERLDDIVLRLKRFGASEVYLESNIDTFGTYENTLQIAINRHSCKPGEDDQWPSGWGCKVVKTRAVGMKEQRICDTLEPITSTHRLIVDPSCLVQAEPYDQANDFQFQYTRIVRKHNALGEDGQLDALQIALGPWLNASRIDPTKKSEQIRKEQLERECFQRRALLRNLWKGKPPPNFLRS
jgi:hypothetical protein